MTSSPLPDDLLSFNNIHTTLLIFSMMRTKIQLLHLQSVSLQNAEIRKGHQPILTNFNQPLFV